MIPADFGDMGMEIAMIS